jgi:hypothetical protein
MALCLKKAAKVEPPVDTPICSEAFLFVEVWL